MAVHHSDFGGLGNITRPVQDLRGYIPEHGDDPHGFVWSHDTFTQDFDTVGNGYEGFAAEMWADFVARAVALTQRATDALEDWRERNDLD